MKLRKLWALALTAAMTVTALTGCSGSPTGTAGSAGTKYVASGTPVGATGVDAQLTISPGPWNNIEWTTYQHQYVTLQIPKGWKVTVTDLYQGGQTGSGTVVGIQDPTGEIMVDYIDFLSIPSIYMSSPTVESFFRDTVINQTSTISNFTITSSVTTEAQKAFMNAHSDIVDAKVLTADFVSNGKTSEGMYTAYVSNMMQYSGLYCIMTAIDVVAPKGTLSNWNGVFMQILGSIQWTDACKQRYNVSVQTTTGDSKSSSDIIMEGWENRNKSEDIMSQKRSDATLGYERVYDTTTNDIYQAPSGFYQQYSTQGGERYKPITDDMYTQGYVGTIGF